MEFRWTGGRRDARKYDYPRLAVHLRELVGYCRELGSNPTQLAKTHPDHPGFSAATCPGPISVRFKPSEAHWLRVLAAVAGAKNDLEIVKLLVRAGHANSAMFSAGIRWAAATLWKDAEREAEATLRRAPKEGRGANRIPSQRRTRPLALSEAARLLWTSGTIKKRAERLRGLIVGGNIAFERLNRQSYVFDRGDFQSEVHNQLLPGAAKPLK